ncbi:MAG: aldehyde dehydrogenase family protein [Acidobacteriota bacterium]|nr:aldehyde dehydrogenase family protein [Pyrinomonadaceae bacterium]MDW8303286.1 aldehyde dehydrogenase family protein [Acidobacteriota bacterium]
MKSAGMLIGGRWIETDDKFEVRNPFSGEILAEVSKASEKEIDEAIREASNAAQAMKGLASFQIADGLRAISKGIEKRKQDFIFSIVRESAKPLIYARAEVERAIATFSWAAGEAERFAGEVVPIDVQPLGRGKIAIAKRFPRGIIYGITPFNFPLNLVAHKVAPALASRNAIIIKPSPRTPLTAFLLGEVFLESGLPENALQIVPMDVELMPLILGDDRIKMISFTGSAEVGWKLKGLIGKKALTLELGGNAATIIDETADIEASVSKNVIGAFAFSGQVCISVQRVFVHERLFDEWLEKFVNSASALRKGDPMEESTQISVMIDENAARRIESWVNEAISSGATLLCGGRREQSFYEPTVLTNTSTEMKVVSEEAFAPVAVVERFSSFEEAIQMANQTKYGLQVGVFTKNFARAKLAFETLEYGGVMINEAPSLRVDSMPYGGVKDSGFGREGIRYAMEEMTEIRLMIF